MKSLYPEHEWDFVKLVRDKFFEGRQRDREASLEDLSKMLSALQDEQKSASCAQRLRSAITTWNWKWTQSGAPTLFCRLATKVCSTLDLFILPQFPEIASMNMLPLNAPRYVVFSLLKLNERECWVEYERIRVGRALIEHWPNSTL